MVQESGTKPRVLLVDDERFNLTTLHALLNDSYKIMVATSGDQAIAAVLKAMPDLILLDINMPGMDGYEVCSKLKNDPLTAAIPIIFITANTDIASEAKGLELGAEDYIAKPFNPQIVLARVRTQIRLKQQADLLAQYAYKDGLTQVMNRRFLDEQLPREIARSQRSGLPLSLIIMDIDFFKKYNDHYGHIKGDDCLKQVAQAVSSVIQRPADTVIRYGGEEFVIVLPDTDLNGAASIADSIREAVLSTQIVHAESPVSDYVSISLGVASNMLTQDMSSQDLLSMADAALYRAKEKGRNRAETAG